MSTSRTASKLRGQVKDFSGWKLKKISKNMPDKENVDSAPKSGCPYSFKTSQPTSETSYATDLSTLLESLDSLSDFGSESSTVPSSSTAPGSKASSGSEWDANPTKNVRLDFTPTKDDEKDYKKCSDFWTYIDTRKDFKRWVQCPGSVIVKPSGDIEQREEDTTEVIREDTPLLEEELNLNIDNAPAIGWLCEVQKTETANVFKQECVARQDGELPTFVPHTEEAKKVLKQMDNFNKSNPKDFDPPGRPKWNWDI